MSSLSWDRLLKKADLVSSGVEAKNCYSGWSGDCKTVRLSFREEKKLHDGDVFLI